MKLYLGGPMRGYDQFNFKAFDQAAAHLREFGYVVVSPAEHDRSLGFDETRNSLDGFDVDAALAWDLEAIIECELVVFLPGWRESSGSRIEYEQARKLGIPIYEYKGTENGGLALWLVEREAA